MGTHPLQSIIPVPPTLLLEIPVTRGNHPADLEKCPSYATLPALSVVLLEALAKKQVHSSGSWGNIHYANGTPSPFL